LFGDRFEILFVCHANFCRSPMAELLAARAFGEAFGTAAADVVVSSAGTHAYAGSSLHDGSAAVLWECGIDARDFASRTVSPSILLNADLVLTAGREQRAACVTLAPATVRRTFTLRQFTRLAAGVPQAGGEVMASVPGRLRVLVDRVNAGRHLVANVPAEMDDLPDPVDQPIEAFRECAEEIWQSLGTIIGVISVP
jgi:low molecular weight protein-tyrosine phosphatase